MDISMQLWMWSAIMTTAIVKPGTNTVSMTSMCDVSQGWKSSDSDHCVMVSTELSAGQVNATWDQARQECSRDQQWGSLASLPTDQQDNHLAGRLRNATPHWVGMKITYQTFQRFLRNPIRDQLVWLDGSNETRRSHFITATNLNIGSPPSDVCGHVTLTIFPYRRKLTWTLDRCVGNHPYICLILKANVTLTTNLPVTSSFFTVTTSMTTATVAATTMHAPTSPIATMTPTATSAQTVTTPPPPPSPHTTTPSIVQTSPPDHSVNVSTLWSVYSTSFMVDMEDIRHRFNCTSLSIIRCIVNEVGPALKASDEQAFFESIDIIYKAMIGNINSNISISNSYLVLLEDFLQVVDTVLDVGHRRAARTHYVIDDGQHVFHEIDKTVMRLDEYMEELVSKMGKLRINRILSLNLSHINVVLKASAFMNQTVEFDMNEINVINAYPASLSYKASSGECILSAVLINSPLTSVTLANGPSRVRAHVVSHVMSVLAYDDVDKMNLSHNFKLATFQNQDNTSDFICAFQTYDKDTGELVWDTYGCETVNASCRRNSSNSGSNDTKSCIVTCRCNHTTNFAILMRIAKFETNPVHELVLNVVTYVGCSVSLVTQVLAVTVFTVFKSLNSERVCVHRNLCLSVIGLQLTFISGIKSLQNPLVCSLIAVVLHYFSLATFVWMLVEGLHLYSQVIQVFGTERSRIIYYMCVGWGLPAVLVTLSAAVDWAGYGTAASCWLSITRNTIWAFVAPAASVIAVNVLILVLVLKVVVTSAHADRIREWDHVRAGVKAALFLSPLLGITWLLGLAAVSNDLVLFQYLFAVFNSFQGFFIFLFHCILNSEVRQTLKRVRERRSIQRGSLTSTDSTDRRSSDQESNPHSDGIDTIRESISLRSKKSNRVMPDTDFIDSRPPTPFIVW